MIVEMAWGRPHHIVVYDLDDSGELLPSRTIRNGEPDPECRRFSCRVEVWRALQVLAGDHGWVLAGTSLDPTAERRNRLHTDLIGRGILSPDTAAGYRARLERATLDVSYEPQTWAYAKVVSGADAAARADALGRALPPGRAVRTTGVSTGRSSSGRA